MFPGQSSARPDVLVRARQAHPAAGDIARRAAAVLDPGDAAAWLDPAGARLSSNRDVQAVVFLATQMYLAALASEGVEAERSLGLSLGEYSHLVHIGALRFEDGLRLVLERGRCFDQAPTGMMVTALAVDLAAVAAVVEQAGAHGTVVISNYNAPTQHVISGAAPAVQWAAQTLEDEHAAHTTVIEERVPMHSPLMRGVAEVFGRILLRAPWRPPSRIYRPNVTAASIAGATPADFVAHLTRHVSEPVRWQASIDAVVAESPEARLVEVGPGSVLHNLVARAWRGVGCARVDRDDASPPRHLASTLEALRA
jgi:[acyl-carrier-protein] S-malonyltransferase